MEGSAPSATADPATGVAAGGDSGRRLSLSSRFAGFTGTTSQTRMSHRAPSDGHGGGWRAVSLLAQQLRPPSETAAGGGPSSEFSPEGTAEANTAGLGDERPCCWLTLAMIQGRSRGEATRLHALLDKQLIRLEAQRHSCTCLMLGFQ